MRSTHEGLLAALRAAAIQKHLLPLALLPHPPPHPPRTPFELYHYEEHLNMDELEERVREDVLRELNGRLFEEEQGRLQMEVFGLEEAIGIEENEIALLHLQIEAERVNAKIAQLRVPPRTHQEAINAPAEAEEEAGEKGGDLKDNSRLAIYPCVRIDMEPPRKEAPPLSLTHLEEQHHKSHRQLIATYTKRSHPSSHSREHPPPEDHSKTHK